MIELTVQPTPPAQPCQFDPTQICDPEGIDFAAQLALLASKPAVMDGLPDGKVPLPTGKPLPVVPDLPCPVAPLPEVEPEAVELQPVPIMRPLNLKVRATFTGLPVEETNAAAATGEPELHLVSIEPAEVRAEAIELPVALVAFTPVTQLDSPQPVPVAKSQSEPQRRSPPVSAAVAQNVVATPAAPVAQPFEQAELQQPPKPLDVRRVTLPLTSLVRDEAKSELVPSPVRATSVSTTNQLAVQPEVLAAQRLLPSRPSDPRRRNEALPELARAAPKTEGIRFASFELPTLMAQTQMQPIRFAETVAPQSALPVAHTTPAPAPITHDFAALIDRIVAAREASAAPVALAVRHAEFGPVTLRFEQGESGLTVAATSLDPDFARAAAAALQTERPATADTTPRDVSKVPAQHDSANGNSGGSSQTRQQSTAAHILHASRSQSHFATAEDTRDSGIFA